MNKEPLLLVLAGPSGIGKSTIYKILCEKYGFELSVSATTRSPRHGEINGVHYYFITEKEFDEKIKHGDFIEWALVHGKYRYGTLLETIESALKKNKHLVLEIEVQGHQASLNHPNPLIRKYLKSIFLRPESIEDLEKRLRARKDDVPEEVIQTRLRTAKEEMARESEFDKVVVNRDGKLDEAVREIAEFVHMAPVK